MGHLLAPLEVEPRLGAKEAKCDQGEQHGMYGPLLPRVEEADGHVKRDKGHRKPPCPAAPEKNESAEGYRQKKINRRDPEVSEMKRLREDDLPEMDGRTEKPGSDEQPGNGGDRDGTFVHRTPPGTDDTILR